jgi:diguanylate cyclase (GGDEF)-like protein
MPRDVGPGGPFGSTVPNIRAQVLRTYSRLLRLVLDEVREAVLVFDSAGDVILSNRALERLLGPLPRHGYDQHDLAAVLEVLGAEVDAETLMLLLSQPQARVSLSLQDGGTLECRVTPLSLDASADHRLMTFHEPLAPTDELSELRHRAFHDRLTGLPNRELLLDRLEQALSRRERDGGAVGVIFVDLDGFKAINDQHGHAAGDRVLVEVSERLAQEMRQVDTVGRLGGDEFVIVCDGLADARSIEVICDRIQRGLAAPLSIGGRSLMLAASVGAVVDWEPETTAADLLARADKLMYRAKQDGSHVEIDTGSRPAGGRDHRSSLIASFRAALEEGQLELVYLPLVSLDHQRVVAVEALLRCTRSDLAGIGALDLVDLAEEAHLVHALSRLVLHGAATAVAELGATTGENLSVMVNLSGAQLADPSLGELINDAAATAGIERRLLGFDVAESVMVTNSEELERQLAVLVELDCQLFADDVTGPVIAVELLSELGFSGIKIDGAVVAAASEAPGVSESVIALVNRAHELELSVVAEGLSDERTLQTARQIGASGGQGYGFYGFPRSLARLKQLIG